MLPWRITAALRSLDKIMISSTNEGDLKRDCWIWTGTMSSGGWQPVIRVHDGGRTREIAVIRLLYEAEFGERPPKDKRLQATCGNLDCVSPYHRRIWYGRPKSEQDREADKEGE